MNLYCELENIFRTQIQDSYPVDWDEDHITRKIFFEYRKLFRNIQVDGLSSLPMRIESAGYKFTGVPENKFGDIGFIVRIKYPEHPPFEGVTSLEAKKVHKKSRKFEEIKGKQLNRISSHVRYPMLLMYDNQPIKKYHDYSFFPSITKPTHAAIVPIDTVEYIVQQRKSYHSSLEKTPLDGNLLYKFSVPLAYQILFRYFRGLDLDFDRNLIRYTKVYENEEISYYEQDRLPQYLLVVSVVYDDSEIDTDFFPVNDNFFREITSSEPDEEINF